MQRLQRAVINSELKGYVWNDAQSPDSGYFSYHSLENLFTPSQSSIRKQLFSASKHKGCACSAKQGAPCAYAGAPPVIFPEISTVPFYLDGFSAGNVNDTRHHSIERNVAIASSELVMNLLKPKELAHPKSQRKSPRKTDLSASKIESLAAHAAVLSSEDSESAEALSTAAAAAAETDDDELAFVMSLASNQGLLKKAGHQGKPKRWYELQQSFTEGSIFTDSVSLKGCLTCSVWI